MILIILITSIVITIAIIISVISTVVITTIITRVDVKSGAVLIMSINDIFKITKLYEAFKFKEMDSQKMLKALSGYAGKLVFQSKYSTLQYVLNGEQ